MRSVFAAIAVLAMSLPTSGQTQRMQADPDKNVMDGGVKVPGWEARLDRANQKVENLKFVTMGTGFHVTTGPAAVFWKADQTAAGPYTVKATFSQTKFPDHQEAYGILIGGSNLDGENQRYTYFLVRQDGKFLIKRRDGAQTPNIVEWTENAAVVKPADSKLSNTLSIQVGKDTVKFLVNGTEVASQPASAIDTNGLVGLRVNHNLDVHIEGFGIQRGTY